MNFDEMKKIKNDAELVNAVYHFFDEKNRLNRSKAARVEFTTTVKYIEKYLKQGMRILDIGAGAGEYSLYFANKGYRVDAVELADKNVEEFRKKITSNIDLETQAREMLSIYQILRMKRLILYCYWVRFITCMRKRTEIQLSEKRKEYSKKTAHYLPPLSITI